MGNNLPPSTTRPPRPPRPLHWAAFKGCTDAVVALLASGADAAARDDYGRTAQQWASEAKRGSVVAVLKSAQLPQLQSLPLRKAAAALSAQAAQWLAEGQRLLQIAGAVAGAAW